jgi:3D (Asp-Asp-Asp) domain-containing protein
MPAVVVLLVAGLLLGPCETWSAPAPLRVTITAYAAGTRTASGKRPHAGMLAVSPDIERAFHLHFGDRLCVENLGTFLFEDRMPSYWHRRIDVYIPSQYQALRFGKRSGLLRFDRSGPGCR